MFNVKEYIGNHRCFKHNILLNLSGDDFLCMATKRPDQRCQWNPLAVYNYFCVNDSEQFLLSGLLTTSFFHPGRPPA